MNQDEGIHTVWCLAIQVKYTHIIHKSACTRKKYFVKQNKKAAATQHGPLPSVRLPLTSCWRLHSNFSLAPLPLVVVSLPSLRQQCIFFGSSCFLNHLASPRASQSQPLSPLHNSGLGDTLSQNFAIQRLLYSLIP